MWAALLMPSVWAGGGDFGGDGAFGGLGDGLMGDISGELKGSSLCPRCSGQPGVSPVATTGWDGCTTMSNTRVL